ncbi:hypothetical protein NUACC21_10280 [Scytonema sp. NUACC21]
MKRYLLASAGGATFLCLFAKLPIAQATPNYRIANDKLVLNHLEELANFNSSSTHKTWEFDESIIPNIAQAEFIRSQQQNLPIVNQNQENWDFQLTTEPNFSIETDSKSSNQFQASEAVAQVTSVSQLSDVQPTDWAFQALQSLVERYGCIAGYPNGTYRGNRALTRYEFAAGLNACLDRVNELIATSTADLVRKEDLNTLQRLQEEFAQELATLRGRVDALEARTAELEANQFSTTTKLSGEAIIAGVGATGGAPDNDDPNIILVNRVRLNLNTSFTGKDLLITGFHHEMLG